MATDMRKIEAQTAHTVKLTWGRKELLEKSDLIRGLSDIPDGWVIADISGYALADYQQIEIRIEPDERMS